ADRAASHQRRRPFHVRRGQHPRLGSPARLARHLFSGNCGGDKSRGRDARVTAASLANEHASEGMPMPLIRIIPAVAALLAATAPAMTQDWPTRPVTMVVPFAAGGAFDVIARVFSPQLSHSLGQQVIVENVGAAAGIVGTNRVAKATPD